MLHVESCAALVEFLAESRQRIEQNFARISGEATFNGTTVKWELEYF